MVSSYSVENRFLEKLLKFKLQDGGLYLAVNLLVIIGLPIKMQKCKVNPIRKTSKNIKVSLWRKENYILIHNSSKNAIRMHSATPYTSAIKSENVLEERLITTINNHPSCICILLFVCN